MKAIFCAIFLLFSTLVFSQSVLKNVGNAAKSKLESQDFNSSRSNKDRANFKDEKSKSSAPVAVPPPPAQEAPAPSPDTIRKVESKSDENVAVSGKRTYNKVYTFDKTMTYEMSNPGKPDKAPELVTYNYSDGALMTNMSQNANMTVLNDFPNEVAINFDEKGKTAMIMSTRWATNMAQNLGSNDETTITKTGQSKEILGKKCEEYIIVDKKSKISCYVTTEVKMNYAKTVEALTKNKVSTGGSSEFPAECLMMEMTSFNRKGEADSHMIMKSYKEEKTTKSVDGYKVTAL